MLDMRILNSTNDDASMTKFNYAYNSVGTLMKLTDQIKQAASLSNNNNYSQSHHNSDDELGLVDTRSDKLFIFIFSILSIPSNIFLIVFYATKIISYKRYNKKFAPKKLKHVYAANCFNTYLVEICSFDTIISIHLLTDTIFKQLYDYEITIYESIFDVSQFTCKFFTLFLHISAAMTGWLTFLLTFNRCMLLFRLRSNRLCINTKYLTLFVFCTCTIANVFRLELLYFNYNESLHQHFANYSDIISAVTSNNPECGFNLGAIVFHMSESTKSVFWSLIVYNIIFSITPCCGNLILSAYLIKKHGSLKQKIILNHLNKLKRQTPLTATTTSSSQLSLHNILSLTIKDQSTEYERSNLNQTDGLATDTNLNLNKYIADFFHTCMPCIAISCTYVICYLPHTMLETINQIIPTLFLFKARIYLVYLRYLFHGCKFYLLFLVSHKFRKEFFKFCKSKLRCCCKSTEERQREQEEENMNGYGYDYHCDNESGRFLYSRVTSCSSSNNNSNNNKKKKKRNSIVEAQITYL